MNLSRLQKENIRLFRQEEQQKQEYEDNIDKAIYLQKYLENQGYTGNKDADVIIDKIQSLAKQLQNILENQNHGHH